MAILQIGAGALYYSLEGEGPTLALIHGVGGDNEVWDRVVAALTCNYRVLKMDLRGHGRSVKASGPYSLEMFAGDFVRLLDHLSIDSTHIAGFSLGGLIAQKIAIDHAERVDRLAIISSIAGRTEEEKQRVLQRALKLTEQGATNHLNDAVDRWFTKSFIEQNPEIMAWRKQKSMQNDPVSYSAAYEVLATNDLVAQLPKILAPTLAITGELDIGSSPRMSRLIADNVANGECMVLDGLKHSVLLEAPEKIARLLEQFMSSRRN